MKRETTRELLRFAAPVALENLFLQVIVTIMAVLTGQISRSSLASIGLSNTAVAMCSSAFSMLCVGGAVLLARSIGAQKPGEASDIAQQSILMTLVVAVLAGGILFFLARPLMKALMPAAEEDMLGEAVLYHRYMMASFPLLMLYNVNAALLRASGNSRTVMFTSMLMNGSLVVFAWLLIGRMGLGVRGAGVAYMGARLIGAAVVSALVLRQRRFLIRVREIFRPRFATWRRIVRVGLPTTLEDTLIQGGYLVANSMAVGLGTIAATAYQVVNTLFNFGAYPQGICNTLLVSFVGRCLGAEDEALARSIQKRVYAVGLGATLVICALVGLARFPLFGLYTSDPQVVSQCDTAVWVMLLSCIPAFSINAVDPAMRAGGDGRAVMIYNILGVWGVRVPLTWLFCYSMNMGVAGVFLANVVSLTVRAAAGLVRIRGNRWIHRGV